MTARCWPTLETFACLSLAEFRAFCAEQSPELSRRHAVELALLPPGVAPFEIDGECAVCGCARRFRVTREPPVAVTPMEQGVPNWRESFVCEGCGLNSRQRAAVHLLFQEAGLLPGNAIYLTEQVTPLAGTLTRVHPATVTSEFVGDDLPSGTVVKGVRHEDLHRLSFPSGLLGAALSLDVFEHLADPVQALREMFRCLAPGGMLMLSVPFDDERHETQIRARRGPDGSIEHLLPPEYHGDPMQPDRGVLVYQVPGWAFLDEMRALGFEAVAALYYWSRDLAYLGNAQMVIVGRKPAQAGLGWRDRALVALWRLRQRKRHGSVGAQAPP